jgi:hypothetical protein
VPAASGVLDYLVKLLLPGSLVLGPLIIKRSADLGKGLLRDPHLLLPRGEGLFPLGELPSWARSSSTTAVDDAAVMPEDNGGGGLRRAYEDKLIACHVTFQPTTMNT